MNIWAHQYNKDSPGFLQQISKLNYTGNDLMMAVSKINDIDKITSAGSKPRNAFRFFAGGGVNISSLKYLGDNSLSSNSISKNSISPVLSVGIDGFINPNVGRLIYRFELSTTMNSYSTTASSDGISIYPNIFTQNVKQYMASLMPQIIYNFYNSAPLKVFLGVGLSVNVATYPSNESTTVYSANSSISRTETTSNYPAMSNFWVFGNAKIGVVLNRKIEIYGRYIPSGSITDHYTAFSGNAVSYQAGINYLFGKIN